ncbi:unnamed protein product [Staurois parvus]|uniref:Uncharacterized protein n=1 Tax=Staurois parvus TaxID=386267 RepID=A0ABN9HKB2_9NEOB|nr:unnamed protein product [Staurois parvus]
MVRNSQGQCRQSSSRVKIRQEANRMQVQGLMRTNTKALIAGLVLLKYTSCNHPQVMA